MRVCVIGCTGYLGSKISQILKKKGHEVIGVCRKFPENDKSFKKNFKNIIQSDITKKDTIKRILSLKIDSIIYTVSLNHIHSEKNLENSINISYLPLVRLCNAIKNNKKNIKFIYFSTMQVYGNYTNRKIITEETPKEINNIYALTHSLCEDTLLAMNKNDFFNSVSIRLSNGYGSPLLESCDCWWLVVNDFCLNALKEKRINLNSDGSPLRDFIHISDIANAVNTLILSKKLMPQTLNLASGNTLSMLDIANRVKKISKKININTVISIKDIEISNMDIDKKIKNIKKLKKFRISTSLLSKFDIKPKLDINMGIQNTLEEINKNNG
tara:strand:- start:3886 stop:4866 length:981 start_codon:yes stop_codon:yes gene_type:complete